nr:hypothetical protein [Thiolapillus sp.]
MLTKKSMAARPQPGNRLITTFCIMNRQQIGIESRQPGAVGIQKNTLHQFFRFLSAGMGSVHEHHTVAARGTSLFLIEIQCVI